jgi:aryl-alcohol dehydrogenase-like predicted oxidoreductase
MMKRIPLGRTELLVSPICLGCMSYGVAGQGSHAWALDEKSSRPFFERALAAGINFFDTANAYSGGTSEEFVGRALKDLRAKREELVIATKVFFNPGGLGKEAIARECDASLRRLQLDYVDLYQIHRYDPNVPLEETLEALDGLVRAGKVRHLGASSMYAYRFATALATAKQHGWARFVTMQPHYNLLYREEEREMLRLCAEAEIGVIPWSPLARGRLARASSEGSSRESTDALQRKLYDATEVADRAIVLAVERIARTRGVSMAQIALAWLRTRPTIVAPIVGATKMQHLEDAIASLSIELSKEEITALEAPYVPHVVAGM